MTTPLKEGKVTTEAMMAELEWLRGLSYVGDGPFEANEKTVSAIRRLILLQPLVEKLVEACGLIEKIGYEDWVWEIRKALAAYLQARDGKGE